MSERSVQLPDGTSTSRLGFGCGGIGGLSETEGRKRLAVAFDAGIRHFDVAPSYGLGLAENVLGRFLRDCGEEVTVTTKAGIGRPPAQKFISIVRDAVKPFLSRVPSLRHRLGNRVRQLAPRALFGVVDVQSSLEGSLKRLGRERIDMFLMHEITQADVSDELLRFLEDRRQAGVIGAYGIGSKRSTAEPLALHHPTIAEVVQTEWCALDMALQLPATKLLSTHGALRRLDEIAYIAAARPELSAIAGVDLATPDVLANVLLGAALANNPKGIVLVTSTKPERLVQLVHAAEDEKWSRAGRTLTAAIR